MIRWFCPYCWKEIQENDKICPYCKADVSFFTQLDYDDKLILALNNPITQNRMVAIEILGKRKAKKAVSKLCKMLFDKRDAYELIEIAKALQSIGTDEALECLKERKKIQDNIILERFLGQIIKI